GAELLVRPAGQPSACAGTAVRRTTKAQEARERGPTGPGAAASPTCCRPAPAVSQEKDKADKQSRRHQSRSSELAGKEEVVGLAGGEVRRGLLPLPRRKALSEADLEVLAETMNGPELRTAPHYRASSLLPSVAPSHRGEKAGVGPGCNGPFSSSKTAPLGGRAWSQRTRPPVPGRPSNSGRRRASLFPSLLAPGAPGHSSGKGALCSPGSEQGSRAPGTASSPEGSEAAGNTRGVQRDARPECAPPAFAPAGSASPSKERTSVGSAG
ncbi:unnamed protein product, partial [Gulo gulo]